MSSNTHVELKDLLKNQKVIIKKITHINGIKDEPDKKVVGTGVEKQIFVKAQIEGEEVYFKCKYDQNSFYGFENSSEEEFKRQKNNN